MLNSQRTWCVTYSYYICQLMWININILFVFSDMRDIVALLTMKLSFKVFCHVCDSTDLPTFTHFLIAALLLFFFQAWSRDDWQGCNVIFSPNRHSKCWYDVFLPLPSSTVLNSPSPRCVSNRFSFFTKRCTERVLSVQCKFIWNLVYFIYVSGKKYLVFVDRNAASVIRHWFSGTTIEYREEPLISLPFLLLTKKKCIHPYCV